MKYVFYVVFLSSLCPIIFYPRKNTASKDGKIPVLITLNAEEFGAFGIPVNISDIPKLGYCIDDSEKIVDTFIADYQMILERKGDFVNFHLKYQGGSVKGEFIIPSFNEIRYTRKFDPEKLQVDVLMPYKVHNLIRYGKWTFNEGEKTRTVEYAPEIGGIIENTCY